MKKTNLKKLLNTYLAVTVKNAMETGELDLFNTYSWATERNGGIEDRQYANEVRALVQHFSENA